MAAIKWQQCQVASIHLSQGKGGSKGSGKSKGAGKGLVVGWFATSRIIAVLSGDLDRILCEKVSHLFDALAGLAGKSSKGGSSYGYSNYY